MNPNTQSLGRCAWEGRRTQVIKWYFSKRSITVEVVEGVYESIEHIEPPHAKRSVFKTQLGNRAFR
jgi:hypothetical protein